MSEISMNMSRPGAGWMRSSITTLILSIFVSGCANVASNSAICDGTLSDRAAHAAALAEDGGDQSIRTGATLIRKLDAACQDL